MYKHECVECLIDNKYRCIYGISFLKRFFGTDDIKYCPEYLKKIKLDKIKLKCKNK